MADSADFDFKTPPLVEVWWYDSWTNHPWADREYKLKEDHKAGICKESGYLIEDNEAGVRLTGGVSANDNVRCTIAIPRAAIHSVHRIRR